MSKSLSEELKDLKINNILEDYIALQKELNAIPDRLNESLEEVRITIEQLPEQLRAGIEILANGVEKAEESYEQIAEKHRAILMNQLDEAKLELRQSINSTVSDSLRDAQQQINQLSRKIESVQKESSFMNNKSWIAVILMSGVSFISVAGLILVMLKMG